MLTGVGSLEVVDGEFGEAAGGARCDGVGAGAGVGGRWVSQREIAARLGINRRTVRRLAEASEPPRYERAAAGSMLDPLVRVIRALIEECPKIKAPRVTGTLRDDYGYAGSVDLVRRRMAVLRPPREERTAQRTGYRGGR